MSSAWTSSQPARWPGYRPDASRSSGTGGNGLGLALCKAICDSQKWTIGLDVSSDMVTARVDFS